MRKNHIDVIWDELIEILRKDKRFKIIEIKGDELSIEVHRKLFMNNLLIRALFGSIIPLYSSVKLKVDYYENNINFDVIKYKFKIKTIHCLYKGKMIVRKRKDENERK